MKNSINYILSKTFWSPTDLSKVTNTSVSNARKVLKRLREELEGQGFVNLDNSKAPSKYIIDRLNIDVSVLKDVE